MDRPTLTEAAAVMAAAAAFADALDRPALASDLPELLRDLGESIARVAAVTKVDERPNPE